MAITSITIENFKGIGDAVTIPIRPVTLLFGKNSSGKSTVLQALRYMREVYESAGEIYEHALAGPGGIHLMANYIDLGGFHSLVHLHDKHRKIRIRIEFDLTSEESKHLRPLLKQGAKLDFMWVEVVTSLNEVEYEYKALAESYAYGINGVEWVRDCLNTRRNLSDRDINTKHPDIKYPIPDDKYVENGMSFLATVVKKELWDIRYLGPMREVTDRDYHPQKTPDESLWSEGLEAWNTLGRNPQLLKKINRYMRDLDLGYSIRLYDPLEREHPIIKLRDKKNKIDLDLRDVGLGISQIVPVLVGALHSSPTDPNRYGGAGQFFAVEQPELHIHPAVQVALGDVFIDGIKNSNRTFLIETHSEHLLLRLMRRMRETFEDRIEDNRFPVTPDDIAVLFVEWPDSQTIIREMPVNERGELVKAWPGGFFEEDIEEVFA